MSFGRFQRATVGRSSVALLAVLGLATPCLAKELAGVNMPESVEVQGIQLQLNGMGLRKKWVFKVYVAGLYLESPSRDAATIIQSKQIKRIEIQMLRDLSNARVTNGIERGFKKNAEDKLPALREKLDRLYAHVSDFRRGQKLTVTYVPGKGTMVRNSDGKEILIEGRDFAEAMFSVWLGKSPVDRSLKRGLLGR